VTTLVFADGAILEGIVTVIVVPIGARDEARPAE
jgi:hypothetical protein